MMAVQWNGDALLAKLDAVKPDALTAAGEFLLGHSNDIAPIETGAMIDTGGTQLDGTNAVVIYYSSIYAHYQHEGISKNGVVLQHPNGRQSKYLEVTITQYGTEALQILGDGLAEAFS